MNMTSGKLTSLVEKLSHQIEEASNKIPPNERNENWTKAVLIQPLIEGLGWNRFNDISFESSPPEIEGSLDYIIKCQPKIGIEAKALDVNFPLAKGHRQVEKGLKQSKVGDAS